MLNIFNIERRLKTGNYSDRVKCLPSQGKRNRANKNGRRKRKEDENMSSLIPTNYSWSNQKTSPSGKSKANTWEKFINTLLSGRGKGEKKYANIVPHYRKLIDIAQRKRPKLTKL